MNDFIEYTKSAHLKIEELEKLSPGDKLDVVCWDRNYDEYWVFYEAIPGKEYDPVIFFEKNRMEITNGLYCMIMVKKLTIISNWIFLD